MDVGEAMNVVTACSGIGAPEHAWRDLPFNFIGCSEIEPFPCAVLEHHYPNVTNFGDMTKYREWNLNAADVDILFAGTPCQSFSVAGLRKGLDSPNGNLALVFLGMVERFAPNWVVWENVPGVLSSNGGRDFGAFLGALGKLGYSFSYRVLDAQYFGVPQRRKRVFLVGHISDWRCAAAVLFESTSLSGDITKSRKKKQKVAPAVTTGAPYSRTGNERVEADALVVNRMLGFGHYIESGHVSTMLARDYKDVTDLIVPAVYENHASDARIKEVDVSPTMKARWGTGGGNAPLVRNDAPQWPAEIGNTLGADWKDKMGLNDQHINAGAPYFVPCNNLVRRILPSEAEQLQGFEIGYSDITYKGKPAPDSQRYKGLGNSMAVPVVRWIGERLAAVNEVSQSLQ